MNTSNLSKLTLGALALVALGLAAPASAEKAPRDAASGQATGKRQHQPACVDGETCDASEVNTAREAGSGMATGKRAAAAQDHNSSRSNKSASVSDGADADNDGMSEGVKSPRDAASGLATGKRAHKPMAASPDLDSDNDGVSETDAQGMAINEKGMPGNTKAKAGKTGSAK